MKDPQTIEFKKVSRNTPANDLRSRKYPKKSLNLN